MRAEIKVYLYQIIAIICGLFSISSLAYIGENGFLNPLITSGFFFLIAKECVIREYNLNHKLTMRKRLRKLNNNNKINIKKVA